LEGEVDDLVKRVWKRGWTVVLSRSRCGNVVFMFRRSGDELLL